MRKIQEVFVVLENRPGTIGEFTRILKKKRIAIYGIGVFADVARLYVSEPGKALESFKEHGYEVEMRDVLQVDLPNKVGALMELTQKLGNAGINIEYLYGATEKNRRKGLIILEVDRPDLALDIFHNHLF